MHFLALLVSTIALLASATLAIPLKNRAHSAKGTFYYQDGNAGSCGWHNSDDEYIVAVSGQYHQEKNCGKEVWISHGDNTIKAKVVDTCPTCNGYYDLDLSYAAFTALADESVGVIDITWAGL